MTFRAVINWPGEARSQQQVSYLHAKEFDFEIWVENPAKSALDLVVSKQVIRHDSNGSLDLMLIPQGVGAKVVLQISLNPRETCKPQPHEACPQGVAAPARGNVAELQWSLPTRQFKPGIYRLRKGGSTPQTEVITLWRRLVTDPPDGHPGCKRWGEATMTIQRADINTSGKLDFLEGTLTRICEQTLSETTKSQVEQLVQGTSLDSGGFILYANWWSRMAESPR